MLARFNVSYPGVRVSVRVGNSVEVLAGLLEYQTDVAVLAQAADDVAIHNGHMINVEEQFEVR